MIDIIFDNIYFKLIIAIVLALFILKLFMFRFAIIGFVNAVVLNDKYA
jgi:hypothetical protein